MNKLALLGGKPVRTKKFPVWPNATSGEKEYLRSIVNGSGWGIFRGTKTIELGEKFAAYHGAKYGIACANATAALQVQLQCLGIGRGDEVITTVYTCISTITAIINVGAIPIFIDINASNYCIDVYKIEEKISNKTKAIIAVHLYNSLCDLEQLTEISCRHNLALIEDAAQVPGSFYRNKGVGTLGISGSFSFQESKVMTSGEGGMIITNDKELSELANSYINCGRVRPGDKAKRRVMGSNNRMTDFQAAVLLGQLELLKERTEKREESVSYLNSKLKTIPGVDIIERTPGTTKQACYYYIFKVCLEKLEISKDVFTRALEAEGILTRNTFVPVYKDPLFNINQYDAPEAFEYYKKDPVDPQDYQVAEKAAFYEATAIWHPFLLLEKEDLNDLISAVSKVIENARSLKRLVE